MSKVKLSETEQLVISLEQLSVLMRSMLWEQAKEHSVSAIQLQILMLMAKDEEHSWTLSLLAKHFLLTKATLSLALRSLEQKQLIDKKANKHDARSQALSLSERGRRVAHVSGYYLDPLTKIVARVPVQERAILLKNINGIISKLQTY